MGSGPARRSPGIGSNRSFRTKNGRFYVERMFRTEHREARREMSDPAKQSVASSDPRLVSDFEALVLVHTSNTGRYVTDEAKVIEMAQRGLLRDYGPQKLADGMHYLTMTGAGRDALIAWRARQPKPPKVKGPSREFRAWRAYVDACGNIRFSQVHREVWPEYEHRSPRPPRFGAMIG